MAAIEMPEEKLARRGPDKQGGQFELSRESAGITLSRLKKYEDLNAPTAKESDEKFIKLSRELWREFAVHGFLKDGKLLPYTDLDGKMAIKVHELAGMDISNLVYVPQGHIAEDRINVDTGNRHGVIVERKGPIRGMEVENFGKTSVDDHHTPKTGSNLSATKLSYEKLVALGLLGKDEWIRKMVEFVNHVDNKTYPIGKDYYPISWRTILGLEKFLKPDILISYFKSGRKPTEVLSLDDLNNLGLRKIAFDEKEKVEKSLERLPKMKSEGFIVSLGKYGKVVVDIERTLPGGYDAAKYYGAGAYIGWNPDQNGFFISSIGRNIEEKLGDGIPVRKTMWLKKTPDPLKITLAEILTKMNAGKPVTATGKLKEYLNEEKKLLKVVPTPASPVAPKPAPTLKAPASSPKPIASTTTPKGPEKVEAKEKKVKHPYYMRRIIDHYSRYLSKS